MGPPARACRDEQCFCVYLGDIGVSSFMTLTHSYALSAWAGFATLFVGQAVAAGNPAQESSGGIRGISPKRKVRRPPRLCRRMAATAGTSGAPVDADRPTRRRRC